MKKLTRLLIALFIAVPVAVLLIYGRSYISRKNIGRIEVPPEITLSTDDAFTVGKTASGALLFELPACAELDNIRINPGAKAVVSGTPDISKEKYGLLNDLIAVKFKIRAISPGKVDDGNCTFTIVTPLKNINASCRIKEFNISEPAATHAGALQLADKENISGKSRLLRNLLWIAGAVCAAAVMLSILYFTVFRKRERAVSDWEKSRAELNKLKSDINEQKITPQNGFIRLSDLVRRYLEKRFGLPATKRTTPEFLETLAADSNIVPSNSRVFLKNFLNAADQVKFAKANPDGEILKNALENASALIDSTRPSEEQK